MNLWLTVGAVIGAALIVVVLLGSQRPRHAEDELRQPQRQPERQPARTEHASFAEQTSLTEVLRSVQARRLTGTLTATTGGRTASLYFLFGHLFHAVNGALSGETAVRDCAGWRDVEYTVDELTPLPAAKTIERPIDEILAA
jgi:uncharacterized protein DUF4388